MTTVFCGNETVQQDLDLHGHLVSEWMAAKTPKRHEPQNEVWLLNFELLHKPDAAICCPARKAVTLPDQARQVESHRFPQRCGTPKYHFRWIA
ncbi:hypothetical protein [Roseateles violae]|uniref:Uncharacterized protein n=1 Tax=Roseateles violae TaxID=3058042 RepID=A0ABT8DSN6_9BURK|nr:hypothetical protein [Pelomonas sp. PFR6]MDN3920040.1 hypothetical protein [Pelomonas sp. PFR6]